jgi:hypothetical protein
MARPISFGAVVESVKLAMQMRKASLVRARVSNARRWRAKRADARVDDPLWRPLFMGGSVGIDMAGARNCYDCRARQAVPAERPRRIIGVPRKV